MKSLLLGVYLFLFNGHAGWLYSFDQAKQQASQTGKPILVSFSGSDWCIPCIKMEKNVFESDTFNSYAATNLVLVKADFPRLRKNQLSKEQTALNEKLAEKYNPSGKFPLTVLLDKDGRIIKQWEGLPQGDAASFVADVKTALHAGN